VAQIIWSGLIGFAVGAFAYLDSAYVAHRNDEPLAVFDRQTVFLFDTVLTLLFIMLFVLPALSLDHALRPSSLLPGFAHLPGWFGFASMGMSAFLIPAIRALICNFGLARELEPNEPYDRPRD